MSSLGILVLVLILILIFAPEVIIIGIVLLGLVVVIIFEFILRLFGKSFDDKPSEKLLKKIKTKFKKE